MAILIGEDILILIIYIYFHTNWRKPNLNAQQHI